MSTASQEAPPDRNLRQIRVAALVLIAVSVCFRFWRLSTVPGLNGDEAQYGFEAHSLLAGNGLDWITPNFSLLSPVYLAPSILLNALFPPSVLVLRSLAVASGIAALAVNFVLCRRLLGESAAIGSTLLLAVLPADIAVSRFGCVQCASLLTDLPVVYGALELALGQAMTVRVIARNLLFCLLAVLLHLPNLLAALLFLVAAAYRLLPALRRWVSSPAKMGLVAAVAVVVVLALVAAPHALRQQSRYAAQMRSLPNRGLVLGYANFFSGRNAFEYVAGLRQPLRGVDWADAVSIAPWAAIAIWLVASWRGKGRFALDDVDRIVASGWMLQLVAFAVLVGPSGLLPKMDRYALCLIVPAVLLCIRFLERVRQTIDAKQWAVWALLLILCSVSLASFKLCYFDPILRTGGESEEAFRAGPIDPKEAAVDMIVNQCPAGSPILIATHSWWTYAPARYFSARYPQVSVLLSGAPDAAGRVRSALLKGQLWTMEMASERETRRTSVNRSFQWWFGATTDYSGRLVVLVGHPLVTPVGSEGKL